MLPQNKKKVHSPHVEILVDFLNSLNVRGSTVLFDSLPGHVSVAVTQLSSDWHEMMLSMVQRLDVLRRKDADAPAAAAPPATRARAVQ